MVFFNFLVCRFDCLVVAALSRAKREAEEDEEGHLLMGLISVRM